MKDTSGWLDTGHCTCSTSKPHLGSNNQARMQDIMYYKLNAVQTYSKTVVFHSVCYVFHPEFSARIKFVTH